MLQLMRSELDKQPATAQATLDNHSGCVRQGVLRYCRNLRLHCKRDSSAQLVNMEETMYQQQHIEEEEECCWICLQPENQTLGQLEQPCACPRLCHMRCLSRWQLQSAGRSEETHCRFCHAAYSDWKQHLVPRADSSGLPPRPATPVMAIFFEGQSHRIKVYPGAEGKARFEQQIRELIQLDDEEEFDISFECKAPDTGALLHLDGMNAFDAATHCAAFTAAERISKQQQEQEGQEQLEQDDSSMDSSMDSDDDVIQEPLQYRQASFDAASVPVGVGMQYMCPGSDSMAAEA